ncbi:MAG TPA: hypothetical protein VM940_02180 [Chthoniobacterales bacterium]|nr:hypothetical protein [Chthoniobacterales bacterium]
MKRVIMVLAALVSFGVAITRADDVVILERTASDFDTWGATNDGRERVLAAISRDTGVPISVLETQRERTRLGYGGLFIANSLASATGQTFDEIAALKASGHGWGWIAKQHNVKLGPIISRARNANKPFKNDKIKVKKVKKHRDDPVFDDDFDGNDRGFSNGHVKNKGPKPNASFHSNGNGKGKGKGR